MNPGYLTYVLVCILFILLASGWKDILFHGVSRTSILLFFIGWVPLNGVTIHAAGLPVRLSAVFLFVMALLGTAVMEGVFARIHVWCAGLLLGAFDLLMRELNGWSMVHQHFGSALNAAVVMAVLTLLLGRSPLWQFIAITAGLLAADCAYLWLHRLAAAGRAAGGPSFSDRWLLTLCAARGFTAALEQLYRYTRSSVKQWMDGRNEWGE